MGMVTREATRDTVERLCRQLESVILGKGEVLQNLVIAILGGGHVLMEDRPGVGKTTLAKALALSLSADFKRVQFTPDLLPTDILGSSVYNPKDGSFAFKEGPIFTNIVLADEINRASPRTQSALLECMNEGNVSLDGGTHELPRPFLVIATQNPLEFEGTYPLPESQLDRFLLRIRLGYPDPEVERDVLRSRLREDPLESLRPVISGEELRRAIRSVRDVRVDESLLDYVLEFLTATRRSADFLLGASPRAGLGWVRAAQALALFEGRDYCIPDDFKELAQPVLAHRVVPVSTARVGDPNGHAGEDALAALLESTPIPT